MLVPEVWCRVWVPSAIRSFLLDNGLLEKIADFEWQGRTVLASRLGYRITALFAERFLGRIFETPDAVFPEEILRPEKQDTDAFAAGVDAIVAAQKRVAENYFFDGSVDAACPPLRALLHIMARAAMGREEHRRPAAAGHVLARIRSVQRLVSGAPACQTGTRYRPVEPAYRRLGGVCRRPGARQFDVTARLAEARRQMARVSSVAYLASDW